MPTATLTDWRTITDEKEKYQAYLCSREWAEKREAVRERAKGKCERCNFFPMEACHHLTYARKFDESLEDLASICNLCHSFTHGKGDLDPCQFKRTLYYFSICKHRNVRPLPFEIIQDGDGTANELIVTGLLAARSVLYSFQTASMAGANLDDHTEDAIERAIECVTGFYVPREYLWQKMFAEIDGKMELYVLLGSKFGVECQLRESEVCDRTEEDEE